MEIQVNEQKPSVKLTKNSLGYGWEVKLYKEDGKSLIEELKKINEKLKKEFGGDLDEKKK